jgi:Mrp family chromosome partitioning ATPase
MRLRDASVASGDQGRGVVAEQPIGLLLQEAGVLDADQVEQVEERQKTVDLPFAETAIEMGLVEPQVIERVLDEQVSRSMPMTPRETPSSLQPVIELARRYQQELRNLLTSLAKGQGVQRTPQRLVVAGVHTASEASTVAASLALISAAGGYRVLLVDANLDEPVVDGLFGVTNTAGLSSLLSSSNPPHRMIQTTSIPNLAVITTGPATVNFSSLLARERVFHRLNAISTSFDYIIADCGSLAPSLVGRVSAGADNVIIAVKEHVSSMRELANVVETLQAEAFANPSVLMIE